MSQSDSKTPKHLRSEIWFNDTAEPGVLPSRKIPRSESPIREMIRRIAMYRWTLFVLP